MQLYRKIKCHINRNMSKITLDEIQKAFHYNPDTGILVRIDNCRHKFVAKRLHRLVMINHKRISAAQVAWRLVWGNEMPSDKIFFRDGNCRHLVFSNLTTDKKEKGTNMIVTLRSLQRKSSDSEYAYVSGKISGEPNYNREAFYCIAEQLQKSGWKNVLNPLEQGSALHLKTSDCVFASGSTASNVGLLY